AGVPGLVNVSVRFRNEAAWIKRESGYLVRVTRPGVRGDGHVSEKDVTGHLMDACIDNAATPSKLYVRFMMAAVPNIGIVKELSEIGEATRAAYAEVVPTGT
ncbi:MAG TPA: hypothetical protein VGM47_08935, partial [Gammaproteobacteria bacterium]